MITRHRPSGREILVAAIAVVMMAGILASATWRLALLTGAVAGLIAVTGFRFSGRAALLAAAVVTVLALGGLTGHGRPPARATHNHRPAAHQAATHRGGPRQRQDATKTGRR